MIGIVVFASLLTLGSAVSPRAIASMSGKQPKLLQRDNGCPGGLEPLGGSQAGVVHLAVTLHF
jgi:hypothetical protein